MLHVLQLLKKLHMLENVQRTVNHSLLCEEEFHCKSTAVVQ